MAKPIDGKLRGMFRLCRNGNGDYYIQRRSRVLGTNALGWDNIAWFAAEEWGRYRGIHLPTGGECEVEILVRRKPAG